MLNKELKKLSRRELVDIIYQLKKNEQQMEAQIAALEESLQEKRIRISVAGSIAEAALGVTNVFSTAQMAADLYLHEIERMKEETEKECERMLEEANRRAERTILESKKRADSIALGYQAEYKKLQQLRAEVQRLEDQKLSEDSED